MRVVWILLAVPILAVLFVSFIGLFGLALIDLVLTKLAARKRKIG